MVESSNLKLSSKDQTEQWLKQNDIWFHTVTHKEVVNIPAMLEEVKFVDLSEDEKLSETIFAKNLFLYNKTKKEQMWLVIAAHNTIFDMKDLCKHFGLKSGNLRGGSKELMEGILGTKSGVVNVFALLNDSENKIKLIMDSRLMGDEFKHIGFHPMDNSATTAIRQNQLQKVIDLTNHEATVLDFSTISNAAEESKKQAPPQKQAKGRKKEQCNDKEQKKEHHKQEKAQKEDVHKLAVEYKKEKNFSMWYSQTITKSELIEYYEISGCYILRPPAFFIWEQIQQFIDSRIKKIGVQNVYFPMFVSEQALIKEKDHLEGFSPEVAWVTKSGQSDMAEPIAIRPTSETIMYPAFAKWIHSHRDLPLLVNQWTNVVRWEFKHPTPFIRTREFLWQEGHTAHETDEEAEKQVLDVLDIYAKTYEELLAVPVVKGRKSEDEKFAGAKFTTTVEIYVPVSGRGIQGATSHHLGQNFSKMFGVQFEDRQEQKQFVNQTSWGLSTRSIGAMIMVHSDDKGLVLPPKVAQTQIVVIPIIYKDDDGKEMCDQAFEVTKILRAAGFRVVLDERRNHNPGFKFNRWEIKGTPVRVEIGKKEVQNNSARICLRHNGKKFDLKWDELIEKMPVVMEEIHQDLYNNAKKQMDNNMNHVENWEEFMAALDKRHICLARWCNTVKCEENVKEKSKEESIAHMEAANEGEVLLTGAAKTLCIPFDQPELPEGCKCFACDKPATTTALWGRSY